MVCKEPPPSPLLLPVQEGPPGHPVPAFQCHLTRTPCLLRHSAECRVPGAFIPDSQLGQRHVGIIPAGKPGILGSGREGTATAESLGSTIWVVAFRLVGQSWCFSLLLIADPSPIALAALLGMSTLFERHKNCILQFVHKHQSNAVEAAPDLEVVQNPLAKSQWVPDQQALGDHLNLSAFGCCFRSVGLDGSLASHK